MEIVTGLRREPHITPQKDRELHKGILGEADYVLNIGSRLEAQLVTNNRLDIKDGSICMQGTHAFIPKNINDELTISNGTQGERRIDIVVARYEKDPEDGIESVDTFVIQGDPVEDGNEPQVPEHTVGNIQNGDLIHEMPLYEVELDGISVIEVRPVFEMMINAGEMKKMIDELNSNIKNLAINTIQIAAHSGTTYVRTGIKINIDDYDLFVLQSCSGNGRRSLASTIIFKDQIGYGSAYEHSAAFAGEANNYTAYCYFDSDGYVYTKSKSGYDAVLLYGVKL